MAEHDHILLNMVNFGKTRVFMEELESLDWPPPERIYMDGETHLLREAAEGDEPEFIFKRISMSQLTDEQMEKCPNVARGAEYIYEQELH
jgi:hypothetical protein